MQARLATLWIALAALAISGGAGCPHVLDQYMVQDMPLLPSAPTFEDVAAVVNEQSDRVESLQTTHATIRGTGFPGVTANIAYQRNRRFRLMAETALTGTELDLGSNDELFWFWVKRSEPPAVFFCRHAQFANSPARQMVPIEPQWLIESLGIVYLDPAHEHDGPRLVGSDRLAVRTSVPRPEGNWTKITILDAARGLVLEQHLSDGAGRVMASAVASDHRRDPVTNVTLPRRVELSWPPTGFSLEVTIDDLTINYADDFSPELWTMPQDAAEQLIDLGDPNLWNAGQGQQPVRIGGEQPPETPQ